jgi:acid phosphatase
MQKSVEYKATAMAAFALARLRLDQALADAGWTALVAREQGDGYQSRPPAVILDIDETVLDNSGYQAWMTVKGTTFDPKTWNAYVNTGTSLPIPGAVDFARYAASKGVKVFYVSNRTAQEEEPTRKNLERFGFPVSGDVDTVLTARERPDWGSAKGTRRAFVGRSYRVLLNVGDNFGDFVDEYRGTDAERLAVLEQHRDRWGREWIMVANPAYGSFESAPFKHDFKLSEADRRRAKREALEAWSGP